VSAPYPFKPNERTYAWVSRHAFVPIPDLANLAAATVSVDNGSLFIDALGDGVVMRVVRATIVWAAAALMVALAKVLEVPAHDKRQIEVVPQIGHSKMVGAVAYWPDGAGAIGR
jgi:hypothetical protein